MKKKSVRTKKKPRAVQPISEETFIIPTGNTLTTSTNPNAGDIIWFEASEKPSIFRGLISRLKSLFSDK